jgi:hypothetical protein
MDIHPAKELLIRLLDKKVMDSTTPLEVLTRYEPRDKIPCYTISISGGSGEIDTWFEYNLKTLPEDHPLYDPENPDEEYATEKIQVKRSKKVITLHAWSHDSELREHMVEQAIKHLEKAALGCYQYCTRLDSEGICQTTSEDCDAPLKLTPHSIEGRCPYPDVTDEDSPNYRNPQSYFELLGVPVEFFKLRGDEDIDELTLNPVVYHTAIPIDYIQENRLVIETAPVGEVDVDITVE